MTSPTPAATDAPPTTLQRLTHHVARLHSLLQSPQPGLFTWVSMVSYEWNAITELGSPPLKSTPKAQSDTDYPFASS